MKKRGYLTGLLLALLVAAAGYVAYRNRFAILERLSVWKFRLRHFFGLTMVEDEDEEIL